MKTLCIQLQPRLAPGLDAGSEAERLRHVIDASGFAGEIKVVVGEDDGPFINIHVSTPNVAALWSQLRQEWEPGGTLAGCSIICSEGDAGWDDYKLLHHFSPSESLDEAG